MEVLYPRCSGLDVHKKTVVAAIRLADGGQIAREVRTFETTTAGLAALAAWLTESRVTHVAMEATGVYWKPVWHILSSEGRFEQVLANAQHVKAVPGRKRDVADATWLSELLAHGLIRPSFVPPREVGELRTLMRTRKQLVRTRTRHIQRIQKTLEEANIKLDNVISDIVGKSGRRMLEAIIVGGSTPDQLAKLADPRIKASRQQLVAALDGRATPVHREMLRLHLDLIDALDRSTERIDQQVEAQLDPFRTAVEQIVTMPGMAQPNTRAVLGEIGIDMSRFASDGHLLSWGCMVPRNDESAGKTRSRRMRAGANWLKTTMVQAAWAAVRQKGSRFSVMFHRLKARIGKRRAICAVAAEMLRAIYHMLKNGTYYEERVEQDQQAHRQAEAKRLVRCLARMGYTAVLEPATCPAG